MEKDKTIHIFSLLAMTIFVYFKLRWCSTVPMSADVAAGLIVVAVVTWEQSEGDWIDAVLLGGRSALGVRDVDLELNRLLEDGGASGGFILSPKTCLRDDAVTEAGYLRKARISSLLHIWKHLWRTSMETNGKSVIIYYSHNRYKLFIIRLIYLLKYPLRF